MISLLLLPVLTFVGAHKEVGKNNGNGLATGSGLDNGASSTWSLMNARSFNSKSSTKRGSGQLSTRKIRALNGTKLILECIPAEYLVRTHMAPDFESPQLVRKLDWFHGGALIASFQQDIITGISEEWWVASTRYELRRPFYQLRIAPVLASDSGQYKCSLETDPLFTFEQSSAVTDLLVIVRPPTPSKPHVNGSSSDYTVVNGKEQSKDGSSIALVSWNHSVGEAHRPILRYSILISRVDDSTNIRVLTTDNNRTSKVVDGLLPNVQYAFSVRAENMAGESEFGEETIFRIKSSVLKNSPKIISVRNETSDGSGACVEVEWSFDDKLAPDNIMGYRITVTELIGTNDKNRKMSHRAREWHLKSEKVQQKALICSLEFHAKFQLNVEVDTGFGHTPPAITTFSTSESAPSGPPESIFVRRISSETLALSWHEPEKPNGRITSYQIYLKEKFRDSTPTLLRLFVGPKESSKTFNYNITNILPNLVYEIQLSASTLKGESNRSQPIVIQSDNTVPSPPKLLRINYECSEFGTGQNSVLIEWSDVAKSTSHLNKAHNGTERETKKKNNNNTKYFYKVQFEEAKRKFSLNSTANFIKIDNLEAGRQYSVTVLASFQSATDKAYFYDALPSKSEIFRIDKSHCHIHSSICAPENPNCKAIFLNDHSSEGNSASVLLVIFGVVSTTFLAVVFTYFLKRHCSVFTTFVKNKKGCDLKLEKCGRKFRRESLSLINDSLLLDVSEATFGQTVPAVEFEDYCSKLSANNNDGFRKQFQELEEDRSSSTNCSALATSPVFSTESADNTSIRTAAVAAERFAANNGNNSVSKNRYVNVLAVEHSRIRINRNLGGDESNRSNGDDGYINANYVDSCDDKNVYIATQAPLPHTFADFWAMIWQENCSVIVMITNLIEGGKRKCDQYWPSTTKTPMRFAFEEKSEGDAADFEVVLNAEHANAIFIHRIFTLKYLAGSNVNNSTLSKSGSKIRKCSSKIRPHRIIHHLQFLCWPDHGVPSTVFSLLHFLCYVVECHNNRNTDSSSKSKVELITPSPIVVHCSAGVGRSGSFILIDSMRRHLLRCDRINIQAHLRRMRRQRSRLVQTLDQYVFCHDVLRQLIRHGITRQSVLNFPSYLHFLLNQYLPPIPPINRDNSNDRPIICAQSQMQRQYEDVCKCPHVPQCRRKSSDKMGECITLPGYYRKDEFIVSNWPSECADLWLAIWRSRCPLILLLGTDAEVADFFRSTTTAPNTTGLAWEICSATSATPQLPIDFQKVELENHEIKLLNGHAPQDGTNSAGLNSNNPVSVLEQVQALAQIQSSTDEELLFSNSNLPNHAKISTLTPGYRNSSNSFPVYLHSCLISTDVSNGDEKLIRLTMNDSHFDVKILRVRPSSLESDIWVEVERIQDQLLQCEPCPTTKRQQSMMILDPRSVNSSIPFILCALQSAACQLEAEGFIDVLLYLSTYRHITCGCWSTQVSAIVILQCLNRSKCVIDNYVKNPASYGSKKHPGAPPKLTAAANRRILRAASNKATPSRQIGQDLDLNVSSRTVRRAISKCPHIVRAKQMKAPFLKGVYKESCLRFLPHPRGIRW